MSSGNYELPTPDLLRGLSEPRLSRRQLLQAAGWGGAALGAGALLSACGVAGSAAQAKTTKGSIEKFWAGKKKTDVVNWANWPLYIDVSANNKDDHPSIDLFEKHYGIKVHYYEVIQDEGPFFAKVEPSLAAHQYTGYDVAVITNGVYFTKYVELGWFIPLDHSLMPNFNKYAAPKYKHEGFDPGNVYSIPWQSGFTGIGYNPKYVGEDITSYWDLFNPKYKGHIGMFGNNDDLPNSILVAMYGDPAKTGPKQWKAAAKRLNEQKPLVRQYFTQNYIESLKSGDLWISQAWSGDIFQANASGGSNLKFVIPKEGGVIWTDNLTLLKYAQNPVSGMLLMDWYYRPEIAAMVAEYVNYITPVPDARQWVDKDAAKAKGSNKASLEYIAKSPLVFPTASEYHETYNYRVLTNKELSVWNSIFEPIYLGA
jgi:spermidine/putrescine transport system substrate-binding protein